MPCLTFSTKSTRIYQLYIDKYQLFYNKINKTQNKVLQIVKILFILCHSKTNC